MSEEEQMREICETKKEIESLERNLRCLHARKDRFMDKIQYVHSHLELYFSPQALQSGATVNADLRAWPNQETLAALCADLSDTERRLRQARERLSRF